MPFLGGDPLCTAEDRVAAEVLGALLHKAESGRNSSALRMTSADMDLAWQQAAGL
jgi:hypothetical protein